MDVLRGRDTFSQREVVKPRWRHWQEVVTVERDALTALISVHVEAPSSVSIQKEERGEARRLGEAQAAAGGFAREEGQDC